VRRIMVVCHECLAVAATQNGASPSVLTTRLTSAAPVAIMQWSHAFSTDVVLMIAATYYVRPSFVTGAGMLGGQQGCKAS
jgi:hypothetical protein